MADPYFRDKANQVFTEVGNHCWNPFINPDVVLPPATIACNASLAFSGGSGIYEAVAELGTNTGIAELEFEAIAIPDRFQIEWDGVIVADSLFVGDEIAFGINETLGNYTLDRFLLDENGDFNLVGVENITVTADDIASDVGTDRRDIGGHGNQLGVVPNYPSPTALASNGQVKLQFNKTSALPSQILIRVIGINSSTVWRLENINCP